MKTKIVQQPELDTQAPKAKWGPIAAVTVTIGIFFGSQLLAGFVLLLYPAIHHWNRVQSLSWLDHLSESVSGQFASVLIVEALTLLLLWMFLRHRKARAEDIGLKRPKLIDIIYALAGFACYFIVYIIIIQLISGIHGLDLNQKQELGFNTNTHGSALWLVFVSLAILPPITEEIVMRGFLYTGLRSKLPVIQAALITSVLFALPHLQPGTGNKLLWIAAIDTFTLSLFLVYLRQKTGRLWASIGVHMIKNSLAFAALFIFKI